jgi:hypothetical protein
VGNVLWVIKPTSWLNKKEAEIPIPLHLNPPEADARTHERPFVLISHPIQAGIYYLWCIHDFKQDVN